MVRVPDELIDDIRSKFDIIEIIGRYIELKKKGRTYFGLCPFHSEKTPSFAVSPEKQIYHCFGCGSGGNVYSFLMNIEGWNFIDTVKMLAEEAGIKIDLQEEDNKEIEIRNRILHANELVSKLYHHILLKTDMGNSALNYLYDRGFTKNTIEEFQLGYAPNSNNYILKFLIKRGFTEDELLAAGLISTGNNNTYDRFRNRIMFPIWDGQGKVIAFGGRIITQGEPKYLNTSDTQVFNKSRILYNFHRSRADIRAQGIGVILEGYIDVIAAYQKGIKNVVATLGTSLTEEHAKLLRRNVEQVVLVYDADDAGRKAALRGAKVLSDANIDVKIAQLPDGLDPDDYLKLNTKESFHQLLETAISSVQLKIQLLRSKYSLDDGEDKVKYALEVVKIISDIEQSPIREYLLNELSAEVNLSIESLRDELNKYRINKSQKDKFKSNKNNWNNRLIYGKHSHNYINQATPAFLKAEQEMLWIMLNNLEQGKILAKKIKSNFQLPEHSLLAAKIYSYYQNDLLPSVSNLLYDFQDQPDVIKVITNMQFQFDDEDNINEQKIDKYINSIEKRTIEIELQNLQNKLEVATKTGNQEMIVELLSKIQNKQKYLKLIN